MGHRMQFETFGLQCWIFTRECSLEKEAWKQGLEMWTLLPTLGFTSLLSHLSFFHILINIVFLSLGLLCSRVLLSATVLYPLSWVLSSSRSQINATQSKESFFQAHSPATLPKAHHPQITLHHLVLLWFCACITFYPQVSMHSSY